MPYELQSTTTFRRWFSGLSSTIKNTLLSRLARVENGHFGDHKALTGGLFELRCFFGGGVRVYYTVRGQHVVLLLAGGDKSTQSRDIAKAKTLLAELED